MLEFAEVSLGYHEIGFIVGTCFIFISIIVYLFHCREVEDGKEGIGPIQGLLKLIDQQTGSNFSPKPKITQPEVKVQSVSKSKVEEKSAPAESKSEKKTKSSKSLRRVSKKSQKSKSKKNRRQEKSGKVKSEKEKEKKSTKDYNKMNSAVEEKKESKKNTRSKKGKSQIDKVSMKNSSKQKSKTRKSKEETKPKVEEVSTDVKNSDKVITVVRKENSNEVGKEKSHVDQSKIVEGKKIRSKRKRAPKASGEKSQKSKTERSKSETRWKDVQVKERKSLRQQKIMSAITSQKLNENQSKPMSTVRVSGISNEKMVVESVVNASNVREGSSQKKLAKSKVSPTSSLKESPTNVKSGSKKSIRRRQYPNRDGEE